MDGEEYEEMVANEKE